MVIIQRFGGALNLNVHLHALVLDGCFDAGVRFHHLPGIDAADVADVLATIVPTVRRLLVRRGLGSDDEGGHPTDEWAESEPALAGMDSASIQSRLALGARAGRGIRRRGDPPEEVQPAAPGPCHARQNGFDLHAALRIRAGCRDRLERVSRYALRPPIASDRLRLTSDGQVLLELKRRWTDGATHLVFDPTELLERLAALIPRPRINLILYYGVLRPRSAWRKRIVPDPQRGHEQAEANIARRPSDYLWADLMRRSFGFDVLSCSRCGGRMRLVALIDQPSVIRRILRHLELPTEIPAPRPARDLPLQELGPTAHSPDEVFQIDFGA